MASMLVPPLSFSAVIPVFNGAAHLANLLPALQACLARHAERFEIIVIDDASTDLTPQFLQEQAQRIPNLRIERLPRTVGQHKALQQGIARAQGDLIILLDDDQAHMLCILPDLLYAVAQGADLAIARRLNRDISNFRHMGSWFANAIVSAANGRMLRDLGGPKVFGNKGSQLLRAHNSYLAMLSRLSELQIAEFEVQDRKTQLSRYSTAQLFRLFWETFRSLFC